MDALKSRFATAVQTRMAEMEKAGQTPNTIKDLAEKCEATYEHTRKIVKGTVNPSKYMIRAIAIGLKMDKNLLEQLATEDKIRHKYGDVASVLAGKNPIWDPLDALQHNLTERDVQEIIAFAQMKAKLNKSQGMQRAAKHA